MTSMHGRGGNSEIRRVVTDFVLAFALFWAVALAVVGGHSRAHAVPLPPLGSKTLLLDLAGSSRESPQAVSAPSSSTPFHGAQANRGQTYVLLSIAVAAILA